MTQDAVINELAEKLAHALKERKKAQVRARDSKSEEKEGFLLEGLGQFVDELDYHGGVYTDHDLELKASEYWTDIARAQIDIIGMTCGRDSLRKVSEALEHIEGNAEYNYQRGFSTCADGLHGWFK